MIMTQFHSYVLIKNVNLFQGPLVKNVLLAKNIINVNNIYYLIIKIQKPQILR